MTEIQQLPHFDISPGVVFRLGEELISDVIQALVELIKNSYDADASWVNINIKTVQQPDDLALSEIIIEDNGHGMTEHDFHRGWLLIANSQKKSMKEFGETTKIRNRTPVGDKGLGRLGVQRLGYEVEIVSRTQDESTPEYKLIFSWRDFETVQTLREVPIQFNAQQRSSKRSGTKIIIRDLKEPEQWTEENALNKLQKNLSELISPFREVRDFNVNVSLNGNNVPIAEITEQIRESAVVKYEISFDGLNFEVVGKVKLDYICRAQKKEDKDSLEYLLKADNGYSYYKFLVNQYLKSQPTNLEYHEDKKWFITFKFNQSLNDFGGVKLFNGNNIADPGLFKGEVDYLLLDNEDLISHIWDNLSEYRHFVSELSGIRVYRDGFGVRVGEDWLKLGSQQTSGKSMYGLRPKNVIGYISISAKENRLLLETTSREGFQKTPHFQNFYSMLQKFVKWSEQAQEYLRRGALEFLRKNKENQIGIENGREAESATQIIKKHAIELDKKTKSLSVAKENMQKSAEKAKKNVAEITKSNNQLSLYHQDKLDKLNEIVNDIDTSVITTQQILDNLQPEITELTKNQEIIELILEREQRLKNELAMFYEGVALGLTAEALSHEISVVADKLAQKSSLISSYLSKHINKDLKILEYVESVKSSISTLRKQLSHLDPSLKYVREKRELIVISKEISEIKNFYNERLLNHSIGFAVITEMDFSLVTNKGKFNQIIDNLMLNSEFWLREKRRKEQGFSGLISVEISKPFLRFWDNGDGVAISVEENLFDPFITTKDQGKGRGLGLFIIQQLLDVEGCTIRLLSERNKLGRRFKFEIDFRSVLA